VVSKGLLYYLNFILGSRVERIKSNLNQAKSFSEECDVINNNFDHIINSVKDEVRHFAKVAKAQSVKMRSKRLIEVESEINAVNNDRIIEIRKDLSTYIASLRNDYAKIVVDFCNKNILLSNHKL
jgi:F0F1-type ATP synthase membrane subunit b/b'